MATLPDCALPCFIAAIANSTCSPLDAACQCASPEIGAQAGACVMTSCSVRDALATANLSQRQCGVAPAADNSLLAPVITFTAIAGVAVLLRPVSRILTKNKFWWDDMFNLLAAVVCAAFFGITIYANKLGLGTEMWAVPPDNIPIILSISFFFMLLYGLCRYLTRCSIIFFYLRIFGNTDARPWLWGVFVFNIAFVIVFIFVMCFQCTPLNHFWLRWDGEHPGYCINANTYTLALGIIEAVEDLVLLALPFPFIATLRLTWKKRIPVIVMFAWGLLTLIITIIRIPTINKFTLSANVTLDGVPIALWSNLELDVGLICACLPTLYPLVRQAKSSFAKLTTTLGNSKSNPSSKSGPTFVQNPDGTWPNINTAKSNSQYNNAKNSNSFRAWGLNTDSNSTVTTSVVQAEERYDAGAYVALPDPPPTRDASLTTHKPGMDIEMGGFNQQKEVTG